MNCRKHPNQKMTLLLYSYVCDICDPPKDSANQKDLPTDTNQHKFSGYIKDMGTIDFNSSGNIKFTPVGGFAYQIPRKDLKGYLLCQICGKKIVQASLIDYRNTHEANVFCEDGHSDKVNLKDKDKIYDPSGADDSEYDTAQMGFI